MQSVVDQKVNVVAQPPFVHLAVSAERGRDGRQNAAELLRHLHVLEYLQGSGRLAAAAASNSR